jgi:hypothetical protein
MGADRNDWREVTADLWMSGEWDVYREWGCWWAAHWSGRAVNREFGSAREAMRFVDVTNFEDGRVWW